MDALVAGASSRTPVAFDDSKSGARFERVVLDGDDFLLKHVDPRDDWIMRQTGDIGCIPIRVWESGVFDLVPDVIDHATVGAAREGGHGAVLLRDVGEWLVPAGDEPIDRGAAPAVPRPPRDAARGDVGRGTTTSGCSPPRTATRSSGPTRSHAKRRLGFPQPVPRIAAEGWRRLDDASPELADALRPLRHAPWPLFDALADTPTALLHGDTKFGNLGFGADGRTILIDWSQTGEGPPLAEICHSLALNRARIPSELAATPPSTRTAPRSNATASTPRRGSNVSSRSASWA